MASNQTLVDAAMNELREHITLADTVGVISHLQGLRYLAETLVEGLTGLLKPAIYVASIDPGLGKTLTAIAVLRQWKQHGFLPSSSVLIFVSTKEEIQTYVKGIGLERHEFAIVTSDDKLNALGCPENDHSKAPIMFTTQRMLRSRGQGGSFASLQEFHYDGQRRKLLLWDESLEMGQWSIHGLGKLGMLRGALPREANDLADDLFAVEGAARAVKETSYIAIPETFKTHVASCNTKAAANVLKTLQAASGKEMLLTVSEDGHRSFVRPVSSLPDDLTPMIVLDASARVRQRYGLIAKSPVPLLELPKIIRDYRNLSIHVWERGSGKSSLSRQGVCTDIAKEVAHRINENKGGEWLVIHYKQCPHIIDEIKSYVSQSVNAVIHSTHWGRHTSTNQFAHVDNVVLIGQPTYVEEEYRAQAYAAAGNYIADELLPNLQDMKQAEYQHHYLQAGCRGSIRIGWPCNLYVVVTPTKDTDGWLADVYPQATIIPWKLSRIPLTGRMESGLTYLRERFDDPHTTAVRKGDVSNHLNMTAQNFRTQVLRNSRFIEALQHEGFDEKGWYFVRQPPTFDPCEGDFDIEDLA